MTPIVAPAVLSAALLWAASPPNELWWLGWVALVPAVIAGAQLAGRAGRVVVPLALALYLESQFIPALPFGLADGQWGDTPVPVLIGGSPVVAVALVAIPLVGLLLYALPLRPRSKGSVALAITIPALTLTAFEYARLNLDPGGLIGALSLTQAPGPAGELAAIGSSWLIVFVLVAVNYAIGLALVRGAARLLAVPAGALIAVVVALAASGDEGDRTIRVAAIQPGYDTAEEDREVLRYWEPGTHDLAAIDILGDLAPATASAARKGAKLVVWPEATTFVSPHDDPSVAALAGQIARENAIAIVYPHFDYGSSESAFSLVSPDGSLSEPHPKQRAMWFLGENADEAEPEPLEIGGASVGVLLGVDAQDPAVAAAYEDAGADLLVSATHDWQELAERQRAQARLLARATGLPLIRADWRYGSAAISSEGDYLADAGTQKRRTVVLAELRLASPR